MYEVTVSNGEVRRIRDEDNVLHWGGGYKDGIPDDKPHSEKALKTINSFCIC